jgi:hypothetical protein
MFLVSIAYAIWHRVIGQSLSGGVYSMDYHPQNLLWVLGQYLWLAVSASPTARLLELPQEPFNACSIAVLIAIATCIGYLLWKRRWLAVFFAGWYLITVGPYLPLTNHISDYYLTVPAIGLAMLGGWGVALLQQARLGVRLLAVMAVLAFVGPCLWQARTLSHWYSSKSRRVRDMVRGAAAAHARYPNRAIILHGVDDDLFWYGLYDKPEFALGWTRPMYMTAETQPMISLVRDEDISDRFLPLSVTLDAIRKQQAVVYEVSSGRLRNITAPYASLRSRSDDAAVPPHFVDAANPLFAPFLEDGWYEISEGFRWTSQRAVVRIGAAKPGARIRVRGRVTEAHTADQALRLSVSVNGTEIGTQSIPQHAIEFDLSFVLPSNLAGPEDMRVTLETDRTVSTALDSRPFGLAMGTVAVTASSTAAGVR